MVIAFTLSGCAYHSEFVRTPDVSLYNQTTTFHNTRYIPVLRFCDYYDLDWDWDLISERIEIKKGRNKVVLKPHSNLALINNKPKELTHPVEYKDGAAYIPVKTAVFMSEKVFGLEEKPRPVSKMYRIKTVVIDPGHGGKDPGAISKYGTREKDIVLDVSKRLKSALEKEGVEVILTRDKDVFIPLGKRAEIANNKKADIFISVHANASKHSRTKGFEVYYLSEATDDNARALATAENASLKFEEEKLSDKKSASFANPTVCDLVLTENRRQSKELGYYICSVASDSLEMEKRGVKGARFVVLKGAVMPAILIEIGFLTNRREEANLKSTSFRQRIAEAIARSVLAYKREYERTNGFSE